MIGPPQTLYSVEPLLNASWQICNIFLLEDLNSSTQSFGSTAWTIVASDIRFIENTKPRKLGDVFVNLHLNGSSYWEACCGRQDYLNLLIPSNDS